MEWPAEAVALRESGKLSHCPGSALGVDERRKHSRGREKRTMRHVAVRWTISHHGDYVVLVRRYHQVVQPLHRNSSPDETAVWNLASIALPSFITDGKYNFKKLHDVKSSPSV